MPVFDESNEDDDDSDEEIVIPQEPSAPAASPSSVDTAASIAGGLLSRTGKKNRPSELEEDFTESEEGGYDTSAITYLLLWKVLPCVLGLVILVPLFMYLLGDMFGSGPELPPLGQLEGIVTLDGKVGIAQLRFIPEVGPMDQAKGSMSWAATDANGSYEAMYTTDIPGLVVGAHSVQIAINGMVFERKIEVKEGDNVENFALETPVSAPAQ